MSSSVLLLIYRHSSPIKSSALPFCHHHPPVTINPLNLLSSLLSPHCHHRSQLPLLSRHHLLMSPAFIFCCYFSVVKSSLLVVHPCNLRTLPVTLSINRAHAPFVLPSPLCHHPSHVTFASLVDTVHDSSFPHKEPPCLTDFFPSRSPLFSRVTSPILATIRGTRAHYRGCARIPVPPLNPWVTLTTKSHLQSKLPHL